MYIVKPGDTLSRIAREYGTTVAAIAAANGIKDVHLIRVGQALHIPAKGGNDAIRHAINRCIAAIENLSEYEQLLELLDGE